MATATLATPSKQKGKPGARTHQIGEEEVGALFALSNKGGVKVAMDIVGSEIDGGRCGSDCDGHSNRSLRKSVRSRAVVTELSSSANAQW